ncbi:hypothetical protein KCP71_01890 [Salmonella enterica subsp. enterica]|nr:hypothetical protein KCP71_01890 [Salmonella enterica subsp. enterica]
MRCLPATLVSRSAKASSAFIIGDEIPQVVALEACPRAAFAFPAPVVACVFFMSAAREPFQRPTLLFGKDFGGRFIAQMLTHYQAATNR